LQKGVKLAFLDGEAGYWVAVASVAVNSESGTIRVRWTGCTQAAKKKREDAEGLEIGEQGRRRHQVGRIGKRTGEEKVSTTKADLGSNTTPNSAWAFVFGVY
jgi:hypothetical protein